MIRILLVFTFSIIIGGQSLIAQIHHGHLKSFAEKEALGWSSKLNLSDYKTQKLAEILFHYKIKEGQSVLKETDDFAESQDVNMRDKQEKLRKLLTKQEYKLYLIFNQFSSIDQVEYLKDLVDEYSKNEDLVKAIVDYRELNILPILRVHRGELENRISNSDKEALNVIRDELYETLDKCIIDCQAIPASDVESYSSLEEVLFKEITSQVSNKVSPMNHLLQIARKYEEEIHEEKSHFEKNTSKWNSDIAAIHEKHILNNHMDVFRKTLESNSVVAWKHLRFDAFFMLLDPSTEEESKKILKLGLIVLPHLSI